MKKVWILLAIAGLLLLWGFVRERFEATASIKAPPYGKEDKIRMFEMVNQKSPRPPYTPLGYQDILMDKAKALAPKETDTTKLKEAAGGLIAPVVESFFTTVFKPATVPITEANIDAFLSTRSSDIKMIEKDILTTYFVGQSGVGTSVNTGYAAALAELGQNAGYLTPQGTSNTKMNAAPLSGPGGTAGAGVDTAATLGASGASESNTGLASLTGSTVPTSTVRGSTVPGGGMGTTTGSTTGGGSTSSMGPTSGNSGNRAKQVFGPVFPGQGASTGGPVGDSSKTNKYPELMGGMVDSSTRIPGVGVVPPSKNWQLANDGSLPSADSLGSTEASKFFPTSRSPGDMDLIPDPYRVSRNFSTSSYSSKTEPVPFLTDFSAFLK
jgi:hypothetical protein